MECLRAVDRARAPEKHQRARQTIRATLAINAARQRCRKFGLPFDLDDYRKLLQARYDAGVCELSGLPFDMHASRQAWNAPSLDRIKPELGYVYGNIRVILFGLNAALGTWGEDRLVEMVEAMKRAC